MKNIEALNTEAAVVASKVMRSDTPQERRALLTELYQLIHTVGMADGACALFRAGGLSPEEAARATEACLPALVAMAVGEQVPCGNCEGCQCGDASGNPNSNPDVN